MDREGKLSFIHIADVHYGAEPEKGSKLEKLRFEEIKGTFNKIINECNSRSVDLLLIAGDVFHRRPKLSELRELNYCLSRLEKTRVIMIAGNHDYCNYGSAYDLFEFAKNVSFLKQSELGRVSFDDLGAEVISFSYREERNRTPLIKYIEEAKTLARETDEQRIRIFMAHCGSENAVPVKKEWLIDNGFDYVALGHIHLPMEFGDRARYAGSIEPLDRNDLAEHGYVYGETNKETHSIMTSFVPFASRQYKLLEISVDPESTMGSICSDVSEAITKSGPHNMFRILLKGYRNSGLKIDYEGMEGLGNIIEIDDQTLPDIDFERLGRENADNLLGLYIERIRKSGAEDSVADRALYLGVEALLNQI